MIIVIGGLHARMVGYCGAVIEPAPKKPWWKPPWAARRESSSDREALAAEEAGGTRVGDDEVEGPNSL